MSDEGAVPASSEDDATETKVVRHRLTNNSQVSLEVPILGPNGEKDSVFLQWRGKPRIPEGWKVDPIFLLLNPTVQMIAEAS